MTSLSKACYYHIYQLCCICPYLNLATACTIAASVVHSKLDYCNSPYYKLPTSQLSHLQQIQNSLVHTVLKLLSPVPSLPSYALSIGSESLNASNTSSSHLLTKFSKLPNLHTVITSSLFNVLAVLAVYPSLLLHSHRHPLKITDRSFRYASPCLWNQLPLLFLLSYLFFVFGFFIFRFFAML